MKYEPHQSVTVGILIEVLGAVELRLDRKIDTLDKNLSDKIDLVENKIDVKINALESGLDNKINALESKLDNKIDALGTRLDGKIDAIELKLDTKIDALESKMMEGFEALEGKVDFVEKSAEAFARESKERHTVLARKFEQRDKLRDAQIEYLATHKVDQDKNLSQAEIIESLTPSKSLV